MTSRSTYSIHPYSESTGHKYILDTSALLALPSSSLGRFNPPAAISSFCFYELISHLDTEEFARSKGNVLKCRFTSILDDPGANFNRQLGYDPRPPHEQVSAASILEPILDRLHRTNSLPEFYANNIVDDKGNTRLLDGLARRVDRILNEEEKKYIAYVKEICAILHDAPQGIESDIECDDAIMGLVRARAEILENMEINNPNIIKIKDLSYLYCGYVFERALAYNSNGGNIDSNDYEDASIIRHMYLTHPVTLVTNDENTIKAVRKVFSRLRALGGVNDYELSDNRVLRTTEISWM